jgi:hypothetical protein
MHVPFCLPPHFVPFSAQCPPPFGPPRRWNKGKGRRAKNANYHSFFFPFRHVLLNSSFLPLFQGQQAKISIHHCSVRKKLNRKSITGIIPTSGIPKLHRLHFCARSSKFNITFPIVEAAAVHLGTSNQ